MKAHGGAQLCPCLRIPNRKYVGLKEHMYGTAVSSSILMRIQGKVFYPRTYLDLITQRTGI